MNLSKSVRALVIDRFKTGASIKEIADWYAQKPEKIEELIRRALIIESAGGRGEYESVERVKLASALGELKQAVKTA